MKFVVVFALLWACGLGSPLGWRLANKKFSSSRIIGGAEAELGDIPYQVSVQIGNVHDFNHACGGVIISKKNVLTAAHCKYYLTDTYYRVQAGINSLWDITKGQSIKVAEFIIHPDYDRKTITNDIAILILESEFEFNDYVKPLELPIAGSIPEGKAVISGWGSVSTGIFPEMPDILHYATLDLISFKECYNAMIPLFEDDPITLVENNVCTMSKEFGHGACSGDSGGPLVQNNTLIGLVSWGFVPCGGGNHPSVFSRVSAFIGFIEKYATF